MRRLALLVLLTPALFAWGCSARVTKTTGTLAELRPQRSGLRDASPELQDIRVEDGPHQAIDLAVQQYRMFLEKTPASSMTPDAMRRLADLQVEKQFGTRAPESA